MNCLGTFTRREIALDPTCGHHNGLGGACTCEKLSSVRFDCPVCGLWFEGAAPVPGACMEVPAHPSVDEVAA